MSKRSRQIFSIPSFGQCSNCGVEVDYAEVILMINGRLNIFCSRKCFREWLRKTRAHYG
ncbi:hypothetical protein [Sulfuracidifex metallicus]|uniref:Transcriptional regulator n=1 Tax=Sulfuracidifex metallicus DSM 6482 = JCM 9184 TaxID=523847 RepID=A0A6A9QLP1_SULME|nr:hypothetical protein [Sulfuracidifex metallicus]MUN29916.1 transcriptional regulator [Sulfuracidifex metallicus DSM 6482 = JCM 9184]WOE51699.1 transcriptional regulator [Sulfuracidifex metallicus DSM 6482 = JCM 9184]